VPHSQQADVSSTSDVSFTSDIFILSTEVSIW